MNNQGQETKEIENEPTGRLKKFNLNLTCNITQTPPLALTSIIPTKVKHHLNII